MQQQILQRLDRIEEILIEQESATDKPLTLEEAAEYLDLSPSYVYKLTSQGDLPHYKPNGKRLYFDRDDLRAYLLRGRVRSNTDLDQEAATRVTLSQ
jgi:excisionase family DNA binding protein